MSIAQEIDRIYSIMADLIENLQLIFAISLLLNRAATTWLKVLNQLIYRHKKSRDSRLFLAYKN
ncbi:MULTISPECIES: hypothetical protein [Acinetobacter]|mgnify:CR=1|jgi:hypothetical protein|uniref:hypothetical protein n=1 Tax=Acinetobacter TaxID=469 RepID=UPI00103BE004|nr:hypothetical protein [Acinetobacter sp. ANC 3781]TCB71875.1 hypothetical protein E0H89_15025 [Acinetobacter sp. ANC 3781]